MHFVYGCMHGDATSAKSHLVLIRFLHVLVSNCSYRTCKYMHGKILWHLTYAIWSFKHAPCLPSRQVLLGLDPRTFGRFLVWILHKVPVDLRTVLVIPEINWPNQTWNPIDGVYQADLVSMCTRRWMQIPCIYGDDSFKELASQNGRPLAAQGSWPSHASCSTKQRLWCRSLRPPHRG